MGVGAGLWEHLSAVKSEESLSFLWGKSLAIDLSYWLVQQQRALKGKSVRKPHLRLTFFRVINLIARAGARPIFVVDGEPPPLKNATRAKRSKQSFYASSPNFYSEFENLSQSTFKENVEECVVMLEYLGIPVIRAEGEAESLCAELNKKGMVDACVTPDSDAFVHGAKCVIKNLQVDPKDPLVELYQAIDIKEKLGLHGKQLLALALLVGCDYSPEGVPGVGFQNALRLVQSFPENEILDRLRAWGEGELPGQDAITQSCEDTEEIMTKYTHCTKCGHPGNKRDHLKSGCKTCAARTNEDFPTTGCIEKPKGFRCSCRYCTKQADKKEKARSRAWWMKICSQIATTPGFPDEDIIEIFLKPDLINFQGPESLTTLKPPCMEELEKFLGESLFWDATYVRQKTLPLLSHLCLVELAAMSSGKHTHEGSKGLINGLYRPWCIERVKMDYSERLFVLKWETLNNGTEAEQWLGKKFQSPQKPEFMEVPSPEVKRKTPNKDFVSRSNCGRWFFTTNENMALVKAACPELANAYDEAQEAKLEKRSKKVKRKRVDKVEDNGQQLISTYFCKVESTPAYHVRGRSQASFGVGTDVKRQGLGFSWDTAIVLPDSPGLALDAPDSPQNILYKEPVARRKLSFS